MRKSTLIASIVVVCLITLSTIVLSIISFYITFKPLEDYVEAKEPTCTEEGNIGYYINPRNGLLYADNKGENELEKGDVIISALGHSYECYNATLPTCTQDGHIEYCQCTRCGKYFSDAYGNFEISFIDTIGEKATGHAYNAVSNPGEWVWATDYSAVNLKYYCTTCKEPQEVKALITTVDEVKPTCEEIGFKIYKANVVIDGINYSDEKKVEIPAIGHNFAEEFTVDIAATCSEQGSKSKHCSRCDAKKEVTEIPIIAHTIVIDSAVSSDCTHTGLTEGSHCSVCGATVVAQTATSKSEHVYSSVITDPTYTEQGYTTHVCINCGDNYVDNYVDALLIFSLSEYDGYSYGVSGCNITKKMPVIIPETYKGSPIVSINDRAFKGNNNITEITVSDNVISIGEFAFSDCKGLTKVDIGYGLEEIGEFAFAWCTYLENIVLPDSIRRVGNYAFEKCDKLHYYEYDNAFYIGNKNNPYTILIKAKEKDCSSCIINENTRLIYEEAFSGCNVQNINIPSSILDMGRSVFSGCELLSKVSIGDRLWDIPFGTFSGCIKLSSVTIGNQVRSIGEFAFEACSSLKSITIPDNVTHIGGSAFWNCGFLTNITMSNNIIWIGGSAFGLCKSLQKIVLPKSLITIEEYAFTGCSSLSSVKFNNTRVWILSKDSYDGIYLYPSDLSNVYQAANYLKNTYCSYYWGQPV